MTMCGGGVFDLLIHDVDYCLHLFGPPTAVSASGYEASARGIDWILAQFHYPGIPSVAITGVPQAIDSIITSPNGSSHSIGKRVQRAFCSNSTFVPWLTSPRYSIRLPRCGSTNSSKYSRSRGSRTGLTLVWTPR